MSCENKTVALSYSSGKTIMSCQQKYWLNKVAKVAKDEDYEEGDALGFGKAFHKVLESTLHTSHNPKLVDEAMKEFDVDRFDRDLLTAMLENYVRLHKASGLKVVKCELQIQTPEFNGFIDFIAQDVDGWWLGDNKTAGRHDPDIIKRLHADEQINLYSRFAPEIGRMLELKGPFLGFRYRQSIKSKAKTPKGLAEGTPTYDIVVPAHVLNPEAAWAAHLERHQIALELHNGAAPKRNLNACMDYFRPCEHWSKCFGQLYSKQTPAIKINTLETYNDADLLG